MYGYIYLTTNLINGKIYVGKKKSEKFLNERYLGSGLIIHNAINKYGKDNFKVELLKWCNSEEELNYEEIKYIAKFNARDPDIGYNILKGGNGGSITANHIWINNGESEILVNELTDEYINNNYVKGRLKSNKSSLALKGRIWINNGDKQYQIHEEDLINYPGYVRGMLDRGDQWRSNLSNRIVSEETREKIKKSRKKFLEEHPDFTNNGMFKKGSEPVNKNKICITNGIKNKYISADELNIYENQGWVRGSTQRKKNYRKEIV